MQDLDECTLATALSLLLHRYRKSTDPQIAHVVIAHVHSLIQASYVHTFKLHIYNYMNGKFLTMYEPIF